MGWITFLLILALVLSGVGLVIEVFWLLIIGLVALLTVGVIVIFISANYLNEGVRSTQGEFYFLLLCSLLGMMLMPSARDMLMLFVALGLYPRAVFDMTDGAVNALSKVFG